MAKKSKTNRYFTQETEDYIVEYNQSNDQEYKRQIFDKHLYYPFYKLIENIIHTYEFYYTDGISVEDLKYKILSILYRDKISKFDPSNGAKAYSYFGTIIKRWLIHYNTKNYKRVKRVESFDNETHDSVDYLEGLDTNIDDRYNITLNQVIEDWINSIEPNLNKIFKNQQDVDIALSVLQVFKQRKNLSILKKKALYIYMRELTGCKTPQLTKVIKKLKSNFYKYYEEVRKNNYILDK